MKLAKVFRKSQMVLPETADGSKGLILLEEAWQNSSIKRQASSSFSGTVTTIFEAISDNSDPIPPLTALPSWIVIT
jgi:hypothetical protein